LNSDKSFLLKVMLHEEKQIELAQSEGVEWDLFRQFQEL
jgi:hypothetical protein